MRYVYTALSMFAVLIAFIYAANAYNEQEEAYKVTLNMPESLYIRKDVNQRGNACYTVPLVELFQLEVTYIATICENEQAMVEPRESFEFRMGDGS